MGDARLPAVTVAPPTETRRLGRWPVRALAVAGSFLITLASFGWWLDSRVLDDNGFADVVAQASQRQEVRDYIADQATLRLARTSNFVSAARPLVTDALSTAIHTDSVKAAIRDFAFRAHAQVFEARAAQRVDIDAQQAATTIRAALQSINPALSKKLPANVLDASATISQNQAVEIAFDLSAWIWLWVPIGVVGAILLAFALRRARDPVHAVRSVGVVMAVSGALLAGFGAATPVIGGVIAPDDPGRATAISAFVDTLTGRLMGAGLALILLGLAFALAPGRDGGDLAERRRRLVAWIAAKRTRPRWRFAGGLALVVLALAFLTNPTGTASLVVDLAAFGVFYVGVIVCLRAGGVLTTDHTIARLRKRWLALVAAVMVGALFGSASIVVALAAATHEDPKANAARQGCNGYFELCAQPLDQLVWAASHNSMSSSAYNFLSAEHTITVGEQLNAGARFLMLDVYYGRDDNGLVRTNLAGGIDRAQLERERGKQAVDALERVGALTGTADTSTKGQELYFCHDLCELGAIKVVDVLDEIGTFLDRNLTDVVVLDFEDYVQPKDLKRAMQAAGVYDRVRTITPAETKTLTVSDLVTPKKGANEQRRRLITVSEKHGEVYKWLPPTYSIFQETPYTFPKISAFNCLPKRGAPTNPMFLINHWLRPDGPPDPSEAAHVNAEKLLLQRFRQCGAERKQLPNVIAVDFTAIGDLYSTVNDVNSAIARVTGVTRSVDRALKKAFDSGELTAAQVAEFRGLRRLPKMSEKRARAILGPVAPFVVRPPALDIFDRENQLDR